ncbi:AMP-binding protein [Mycolicibacterium palauense]|uniref:AMP-binding protein n=1 Tax=Mycolicibacterium palauense TaxID=2034511 RepID=UPI000BFEB0D7|nr:AMP-binding protein [Mycolicibacterium palauense]
MTGRPQLLHDLLGAARSHPDRPAVISPDGPVATFAELDRQSAAVARWLTGCSAPGDRVAVVADNGLPYAQLYYGVPRAGRVLVPVNQRLAPAEQRALLAISEPRILLGDSRYLEALEDRGALPPTLTTIGLDTPAWDRVVSGPVGCGPVGCGPVVQGDDPAWLVFTSGSTGQPKGAVHTHRSLIAGVEGTVEGRSVPAGDVYLFPFPMCHIAGYNVLVRHATGSTVLLPSRFRPAEFIDAVNEYGVRSCSLAPTMLHALLAHVESTGERMPSLREIAYGSAAIPADLIRRATARLGVDFHQGYGMTETGGNVTFLGPAEHRAGAAGDAALLRSAGRPHSAVEVGVVDPTGRRLGPDETGEVVVRGAQVMTGYWRDAGASAAALVDGWLHAGDIGYLGEDGLLTIVDRSKDVIITGGENVSSREVEDALSTHPDVEMAAVVGVPDQYWGEAVCAVVVPVEGRRPDVETLGRHVREQMSGFKRPRHVLVVERLPMTTNGKIAKDRVRELARRAVGAEAAG